MVNIDPKLWGPSGWIFLHSITMAYSTNPTKDEKENMKSFFYSLRHTLPCSTCRTNYANSLSKYILTDEVLATRDTLVNWLINIRNDSEKSNANAQQVTVKTLIKEIGIPTKSKSSCGC